MIRFLLLSLSILFAAPAYWTQKSIGTNPVGPFSLARLDTTIDGQIHDTADTLRKYTRDRIKDSLTALRATSTLQAAYGASTAPQITTSTAKGPLTIRRGSASDPDAVLSVQDGSGVQTAYIAGNGAVAGAQVNVSSATANTLARFDAAKYLTSYALVAGDIPALPAYVRRIGDTITGPIVGTTATAAPLINITTTFGNLTNAAVRGTASASGGAAIHGVATGASGVGVWGVSTNAGGDGGLFSGTGGANAVRAIATGGGKAGLFQGDVEVVGATKLASSLTGILKASAGVVSVADTSDFPTRPYLPLAAGSGSPLTGVLYGQGLNFTTTANAPITISQNLAGGFTHPFQAFNSGMVAGNQYNFDFGQSASTNNAGNFGFKYVGAGLSSNYVTLGMYGANDLLTITAAGVPKFSGLATAGFVRANASGQLSSSPPTYADLTGTVPTWNQSTTGNAATATKWATARTLTIGATGKPIDGTGNQSWSLAEIGAQAAGSYQPLEDQRLSTTNGPAFTEISAPIWYTSSSVAGRAAFAGSFFSASPIAVGDLALRSTAGSIWLGIGSGATEATMQISSSNVTAPTLTTRSLTTAPASNTSVVGYNQISFNRGGTSKFSFGVDPTIGGMIWNDGTGSLAVGIHPTTNTVTLPVLAGSGTRIATISATGQIGAVDIGQSVESRVAPGSAVTVTHNTTVNITSISLPAGEWDVSGQVTSINGGSGNYVTNFSTGTTTTSATIPTDGADGNSGYQTVAPNTQSTPAGTKRFVLGSTTTIYLVGKVLMSSGSGSVTAYGWISATRAK